MKKIILLCCLFLMSCSNQNTSKKFIEPVLKEEEAVVVDKLWWSGKLNNQPFEMQVHLNGTTAFGKYRIDEEEVIFRGNFENGIIEAVTENLETMIIVYEEAVVYGVFLEEELRFYAAEQNIKPVVSKEIERLHGRFTSYDSDYYKGEFIDILPLFDHLLLIKQTRYEPQGETIDRYVAIKDDDIFKVSGQEITLRVLEYDVSFGHVVYSESYQTQTPTLLSLGISSDPEEIKLLEDMLGDYLQVVIDNSYDLENSGYTVVKEQGYYSVRLDKSIIGENVWITNNHRPINFDGQLIYKPYFKNGFKTVLSGTIEALIPEGYFMKDKIEGYLNNDNREDVILVLDHEISKDRVLMLLINNGQNYDVELVSLVAVLNSQSSGQLDPYEKIDIIDHKLILKLYGGSDQRWSQQHIFDTLFDYRLIQSELTTVGERTIEYDFITQDVIVDNTTRQKKRVHETITLYDFDGKTLFDQNYR